MIPAILDPAASGVYAAPDDIAALKAAAARAGLEWLAVDLAGARGKADLLAACARDLAFAETFGGNWDALADCLQDLSWRPAPGYVLQFCNAQGLAGAARDDFETMVEILRDAATYWKGCGRVFIGLVGNGGALPVLGRV